MGTTFVSMTESTSEGEIGFWMRDSILELWLRLLALHIPEPTSDLEMVYKIRNSWLLASRGCFQGCVPHDLSQATATPVGLQVVKEAISSLMDALADAPALLNGPTLNLLGIDGAFHGEFETARLIEVGRAFEDLLAGKLTCTVESTDWMPGSPQ
ncbi:MAG: hypothetical protein ACE37I_16755 [Rubinisphaera brasiliensis]|uniref:hypothetical protein n=1 Tax=Rubinisphaera brasiliensis TaxID=119 RepID=UPI00391D2DD1